MPPPLGFWSTKKPGRDCVKKKGKNRKMVTQTADKGIKKISRVIKCLSAIFDIGAGKRTVKD